MNPLFEYIQRNHALAKIEDAIRTKSTCLTLDDFDIEKLPDTVLKCEYLDELLLPHNKLKALPTYVADLKNLHTLAIDYNNLDKFPAVIKELHHLKFLNISHNPIRDLTPSIGSLLNLEYLWCNSCCLTSLPDEIGSLQQLDTFGARCNSIGELPSGLSKLVKLRWLTLDNNKLSNLPDDFWQMENLIHLNLKRNSFRTFPYPLCKLKKLRYLFFQYNDLNAINDSVLEEMKEVDKIDLMNNPIEKNVVGVSKYTNIILPGITYTPPAVESREGSDSETESSATDWDASIRSADIDFGQRWYDSADLDYGRYEDGEDDDEAPVGVLPKLSKYLVTY